MNSARNETYDTIDPLLEYREALVNGGGQLTPEQEAIMYMASADHESYPCAEGQDVRISIVAEAIDKLVKLEVSLTLPVNAINALVSEQPPTTIPTYLIVSRSDTTTGQQLTSSAVLAGA